MGIENYLLKPVNIDELNKTLEDTIQKIRSEQRQETLLSVGMEAFSSNILNRWLENRITREEFWERAALFNFSPRDGGYQAVLLSHELTDVERSAIRSHLMDALKKEDCVSPLFPDSRGRWVMLCAFGSDPALLSWILPTQRTAVSPVAKNFEQLPPLLAKMELPDTDALPEQAHPLVNRIEDFLQEHYAENLSLKWIAAQMKVSPVYLGKLFSQEKGCTFNEYLKALRLNEAKRLLDATTLSIAEVAQKTGWRNENYFYTCFRQETGISPRQWQMREKALE